MISGFRRYLNTWAARLLFLLLVAAFGIWGVADVVRNLGGGGDGSVATVAGRKIELPEAQELYRRELAQVTRMFGGRTEPTPEIRRSVAAQSVERLVTQAALDAKVASLGLLIPDDGLRQEVYAIPALQGADGKFSRANLDAVLRNNGLTEQRFLSIMRTDLGQRVLLGAVAAGTSVSDTEARQVFAFQNEKRVADAVEFPFADVRDPAPPTDAQLQRWYANHPDTYRTPELRRIKAVVLSPETVGKTMEVSEDELKAAWAQRKGEFDKPERRSVEIVTAPDEAKAAVIVGRWQAGADWAAIQAAAKDAGATATDLPDAARAEFPATELADAVFAAPAETVIGPVKSPLGWFVAEVTKITAGDNKDFGQARDELRALLVAQKAADVIDERSNKLDQLIAGGTSLDDLPGDMGLGAVAGTLDAKGATAEGEPAPIPGPPALRTALVQSAFQMKPGDPPHLTQTPSDPAEPSAASSFYAVQLEQVMPAAPKPFEAVAEAVKADWTRDAIRHAAETEAATLYAAVKGGQSAADAATIAGTSVRRLPATGRATPADGVPAQLVTPLFGMKPGEATMLETADGFIVAVLAEVQEADPNADPVGYGRIRDALNQAIGRDVQAVFATTVRNRADPRVNRRALDQIAQTE